MHNRDEKESINPHIEKIVKIVTEANIFSSEQEQKENYELLLKNARFAIWIAAGVTQLKNAGLLSGEQRQRNYALFIENVLYANVIAAWLAWLTQTKPIIANAQCQKNYILLIENLCNVNAIYPDNLDTNRGASGFGQIIKTKFSTSDQKQACFEYFIQNIEYTASIGDLFYGLSRERYKAD